MANTLFRVGNYDQAERFCRECISTARALGDDFLLADALNRLGTVLDQANKGRQALTEFDAALELARRIGYQRVEKSVYNNRGNIAMRQEDWPAALRDMNQALTISRTIGDLLGEFIASVNLIIIYARSGDPSGAGPFLQTGAQVAKRIESTSVFVGLIGCSGELLLSRGDVPRGLAWLGMARHHPSAAADTHSDIDDGLVFWKKRLGLRAEDVESAMEAGRQQDLAKLLQEVESLAG
jgi:hypothetical protein